MLASMLPTATAWFGLTLQTADFREDAISAGRFAFHLEQLPDRPPGEALELRIDVDKGPTEALRNMSAERRLACAHEAHERDVLVQRACHGIRSR